MDTLQDQSKTAEHSRSMAFQAEDVGQTFATAFLQPPPLQLAADRSHMAEKAPEPEEVFTPETQEPIQAQQTAPDIVSVLQTQKQEPESDEIKEPFSLELDFAAGPNDNPTDNDGEDNGTSIGDDASAGVEENIGTIQQKEVGAKLIQNSNKEDQEREEFSPNIRNFNEDQAIPTNDVMSQMENSFGQSFSDVKIHENSETAQSMGARAFAQGSDVHFAPGEYNLNSFEGKSLLGHELTHVVQQRQGRVQGTNQQKGFSINDDTSLEHEADKMGVKAARGELLPFNVNNASAAETQTIQKKVVQFVLEREELDEVVQGLKDTSNQSNALRLLVLHHNDLDVIKVAFFKSTRGQRTLRQYIQTFYSDEDCKVRATALLFDATADHDWTSIALALIPTGTRDASYFSIMGDLSRAQKRDLRRKYNARFLMLGQGSLDADIRSDFDGVDELKAWIISYRNITDADNIYLHTQHITSSNASEIITTLRRLWGYGLNTFDRKLQQWNPSNNFPDVITASSGFGVYFRSLPDNFALKWSVIGSKAKSLILTVLHKSYSESSKQIFLEYVSQKNQGNDTQQSQTNGWAFTAEEESTLNIARARLTSAEHWYDDNEAEINAASQEIVAIFRSRVERLSIADASAENIDDANAALTAVQHRLVDNHEASASSIVIQNLADELYVLEGNQTDYTNKILEIFKKGQLDALRIDSRTATMYNNEVVRPAFHILDPLIHHDDRGLRMYHFLRIRSGDQAAGSYWISNTIAVENVEAATLNHLHTFINGGQWQGGLLESVITYFNCNNSLNPALLSSYHGNQKRIFIRHLALKGFNEFSTWKTFRDALVPAQSDSEMETRAREDMEQERSHFVGNAVNHLFDEITGEDTVDVAETSLRRLQRFANASNATDEEMQVFRSFYGDEIDLVSREYELFEDRLADMRRAKNQVASIASSVVSTVLQSAATVFLGPVAGAVVGQVCGILTEGLINPEYQAVTADNLLDIVTAAATAGAGSWTDEAGAITRWVNNRASNFFLRAAARESIEQTIAISAAAFAAQLRGELDENWIRSQIQEALASAIAEGVISAIDIDRIRNEAIRNAIEGMSQTVVQEVITTSASIVFVEGDNEEAIANRLTQSLVESLLSTWVETVAEHHHTRQQNQGTTDVEGREAETSPPEPDLVRDTGERTAIVPPVPPDVRRAPLAPPDNTSEGDGNGDDRPTIYDLPTPVGPSSPPNHDPSNEVPYEESLPSPVASSPSSDNEETTTHDEGPATMSDIDTVIDLNLPDNIAGGMVQSSDPIERQDRIYHNNLFNEIADRHPTHECALAFDPHTGEYAVVHGERGRVVPPAGFILLAHSHPVGENGTATLINHNPSIEDLILAANNNSLHGIDGHFIRVVTENGVERMRINVQADGSFLIDVVGGDGVMERAMHFENILEYHQWLNENHYDISPPPEHHGTPDLSHSDNTPFENLGSDNLEPDNSSTIRTEGQESTLHDDHPINLVDPSFPIHGNIPSESHSPQLVESLDPYNDTPAGSVGNQGSIAGNNGGGVFIRRVELASGETVRVAIKVFPPNGFEQQYQVDLTGAYAAQSTGRGPLIYGPIDIGYPDHFAFAMEIVEGGFVANESLEDPRSSAYQDAGREARVNASNISADTYSSVFAYSRALIDRGYYYIGDFQGLVTPDGTFMPIDFSPIRLLPSEEHARQAAVHSQESQVDSYIQELRNAENDGYD